MIKRKAIPVGTLFMTLVLALAVLGVGYGLWSKLLLIKGTINTGVVDAIFYEAFTDDDNVENNELKDDGDDVPCKVGGGSCDPMELGPNPDRYDKDVGECVAVIDSLDAQKLHITVTNGYPSYYCTVWYDIWNNGTIPVKIQSLTVTPNNFTNGVEVTVGLSKLSCGQQIDPGEKVGDLPPTNLAQGDVHIHVEQAAKEEASYTFDAQLLLVQWNEFDDTLCK